MSNRKHLYHQESDEHVKIQQHYRGHWYIFEKGLVLGLKLVEPHILLEEWQNWYCWQRQTAFSFLANFWIDLKVHLSFPNAQVLKSGFEDSLY